MAPPDAGAPTTPDGVPSPVVVGGKFRSIELTVIEGADTGKTVSPETEVCTIGSHALCDLVIKDPMVSRFHCEVRADRSGARLRDTESLNGTVVDGVRVVDAFVRDGSRIEIGRTVIRVHLGERRGAPPVSSRTRFELLVGESAAMRGVFATLERAAAATATVLLEGETGTGKTAAARSVHLAGPRKDQPFVIVDCSAIPANLLESELFGHDKGAFTGADARRIGAFEEASGGTLFLDEIGELPLELQPKFLSALENRTVRRLGSNAVIPIDVRVIAATHRDLRGEINSGRFRPDLYFRLAVLRVEVPPLRSRPEDVPVVARHLLAGLGADPARISRLLDPDTLARLRQAAWPGNLRELRNYLERCLVFDEALPIVEERFAPAGEPDEGPHEGPLPFAAARERTLARFERRYLEDLLRRHDGNVAAAAQDAEIDRTYIYRLMRRHGLR